MREILLSLRRKLVLAQSEESRDRALGHVYTVIEEIDQALLAVPQYEDMQKDLSDKNARIDQAETDQRALVETLREIQSLASGMVSAFDGEPVDPPSQYQQPINRPIRSVDVTDIFRVVKAS